MKFSITPYNYTCSISKWVERKNGNRICRFSKTWLFRCHRNQLKMFYHHIIVPHKRQLCIPIKLEILWNSGYIPVFLHAYFEEKIWAQWTHHHLTSVESFDFFEALELLSLTQKSTVEFIKRNYRFWLRFQLLIIWHIF